MFDLNERANIILRKYEKYDADAKKKNKDGKHMDAFAEECAELEAEIERLMLIAAEVAQDGNKAAVASKNAEIRRVKNVLLNEAISAIQKMVKKGKGLNKELIADRQSQVQELVEKIYAIPDGMSLAANKRPNRYNKLDKHGKKPVVMLDVDNTAGNRVEDNPLYWQENEETQRFEKHWEERKGRQDEQLDRIDGHVSLLKEIAENMGDAIDRQDPVIDDIETQITKHTAALKTNNVKLKGLIHKMANARNFCVDVVLLIILLAIGAYIYSMFA